MDHQKIYGDPDMTRLREAIGKVLGRTVPATELLWETAEDLERYVEQRDDLFTLDGGCAAGSP